MINISGKDLSGLARGKKIFGLQNAEGSKCISCDRAMSVPDMIKNVHGAGYLCPSCAIEWNEDAPVKNSLASSGLVTDNSAGLERGRKMFENSVESPTDCSVCGHPHDGDVCDDCECRIFANSSSRLLDQAHKYILGLSDAFSKEEAANAAVDKFGITIEEAEKLVIGLIKRGYEFQNSTDQPRDLALIKDSENKISKMRAWLASHSNEEAFQGHAKMVSDVNTEETVLAGLRKGLANSTSCPKCRHDSPHRPGVACQGDGKSNCQCEAVFENAKKNSGGFALGDNVEVIGGDRRFIGREGTVIDWKGTDWVIVDIDGGELGVDKKHLKLKNSKSSWKVDFDAHVAKCDVCGEVKKQGWPGGPDLLCDAGRKLFWAGEEKENSRLSDKEARKLWYSRWCELCDFSGTDAAWKKHMASKHGWSPAKIKTEYEDKNWMENSPTVNAQSSSENAKHNYTRYCEKCLLTLRDQDIVSHESETGHVATPYPKSPLSKFSEKKNEYPHDVLPNSKSGIAKGNLKYGKIP